MPTSGVSQRPKTAKLLFVGVAMPPDEAPRKRVAREHKEQDGKIPHLLLEGSVMATGVGELGKRLLANFPTLLIFDNRQLRPASEALDSHRRRRTGG
jgi:hypothetical protein